MAIWYMPLRAETGLAHHRCVTTVALELRAAEVDREFTTAAGAVTRSLSSTSSLSVSLQSMPRRSGALSAHVKMNSHIASVSCAAGILRCACILPSAVL
eukprot:18412-Heterococcus_DN1.PRE.2